MNEPQTRVQQLMGDIAPKLVELTDDVLFGDMMTHLAFYAGWPCAVSATVILRRLVDDRAARPARDASAMVDRE